jgi:hypothetical protein
MINASSKMAKPLLTAFLLTLTFSSFSFGQNDTKNKTANTSLKHTTSNKHWHWLTPQKMTPLTFLEAMKIKGKPVNNLAVVTMEDSFPNNWLTRKDIDTLIKLVNSQQRCNCFLNPLSSYIPNDSAYVGGYAIRLIVAYKEERKVTFGLYACPKVDKIVADRLIQWWTNQSE